MLRIMILVAVFLLSVFITHHQFFSITYSSLNSKVSTQNNTVYEAQLLTLSLAEAARTYLSKSEELLCRRWSNLTIADCFAQLSFIASLHNVSSYVSPVIQQIVQTKTMKVAFWGGSITHLRYWTPLVHWFQKQVNYPVNVGLYGAGATGPLYQYHCFPPNGTERIVFLDFSVNSYEEDMKYLEAFFTTFRSSPSPPLVILVQMPTKHRPYHSSMSERQMALGYHFDTLVIDVASVISRLLNNNLLTISEYFKDDIHPTALGQEIICGIIIRTFHNLLLSSLLPSTPPVPLQHLPKQGCNPSCQTMQSEDPAGRLQVLRSHGWHEQERSVMAARGFQRVKRCWQSDQANAMITFTLPISRTVFIVFYQNVNCTDALAVLDGGSFIKLHGFFPGYSWAPGRGQNKIMQIATDLPATSHQLSIQTLSVEESIGPKRSNVMFQVIAVLTGSC